MWQASKSSAPTGESKPVTDVTDGDEESVATGVQKAKQETVPVLPDTLSLKTLANIERLKQVTVSS